MSARVEYRLGSIFDEECDLLVVPISTGGTVPPSLRRRLQDAGIPFPPAVSLGDISVNRSSNSRYGMVAYAATASGLASSREVVEQICRTLGEFVRKWRVPVRRISAPLLGSGVGDLLAEDASAAAMTRGFLATAPDGAVLKISVRKPEVFEVLRKQNPRWPSISGTPLKRHLKPKPAKPDASPAIPQPKDTPAAPPKPLRTRVFISYSHEDAEWVERLRKHLRPLERGGVLIWDDTRIKAGAQWRKEIRAALAETKVAILLVSADFLASDFITTNELPPLLKAAENDGATILPVIVSPSRFERMENLAQFQAVNGPKKPLVNLRRGDREQVLDEVARAVEEALKK